MTLLGQIKQCTPSSNFITYVLDDKTGKSIDIKMWVTAEDSIAVVRTKLVLIDTVLSGAISEFAG